MTERLEKPTYLNTFSVEVEGSGDLGVDASVSQYTTLFLTLTTS